MSSFMNALVLLGEFCYFALRSLSYTLGAIFQPKKVFSQLASILFGALPLGIVAGIALGAVVWMHTHSVLKRFNAVDLLPAALGAAVLMELAPLGAGLIIAARTGASIGAELGAMRITEQVDALEMLGVPPMRQLVGPRVLACMMALPMLHLFIASLALLSGYAAQNVMGSTTWLRYQTACLKELLLEDVVPAGLKTIVFGYLIAVAGCFAGLRASGGTEGVGEAATRGVVIASFLVLASDVFLVGLIRAIF